MEPFVIIMFLVMMVWFITLPPELFPDLSSIGIDQTTVIVAVVAFLLGGIASAFASSDDDPEPR